MLRHFDPTFTTRCDLRLQDPKTTTTIWMRKATTTIWIIKAMVLVDSTSLETTRSQAILRPVSLSGPKPSSTFATAACIIQCAR